MKFFELRERLQSMPVADTVCFATEPTGAGQADSWVICKSDPGYDVGFCEDGDFDLFDTFDSEDEACEWVYGRLAGRPDLIGVEEIRARRERLLARINDRTPVDRTA
jgi:hypothetical protein